VNVYENLVSSNDGNFTDAQNLGEIPGTNVASELIPVFCDGKLAYAVLANNDYFLGATADVVFHSLNNGKLEQIYATNKDESLRNSLIGHILCTETHLIWLQGSSVMALDRTSLVASKRTDLSEYIPTYATGAMNDLAIVGDKIFVSAYGQRDLPYGYLTISGSDVSFKNLTYTALTLHTQADYSQYNFLGASDKYVWISSNPINYETEVQAYTYDGQLAFRTSVSGALESARAAVTGEETIYILTIGNYPNFTLQHVLNANTKTSLKIEQPLPIRDDIQNVLFNPTDKKIWANAGDTTFSIQLD
jgi:hypothetical protein